MDTSIYCISGGVGRERDREWRGRKERDGTEWVEGERVDKMLEEGGRGGRCKRKVEVEGREGGRERGRDRVAERKERGMDRRSHLP